MMKLLLIVTACLWAAVLGENDIRCRMRLEGHTCSRNRNGRFFVDGTKITMRYTEDKVTLNCNKQPVLESPALPHFRNDFFASRIELYGCHIPTENSYEPLLKYMRIMPQQKEGELSLSLVGFNSSQTLTPEHFMDLANITSLDIRPDGAARFSGGFLSLLPNLHYLKTTDLSIDVTDGTGIKSLITNSLEKVQLNSWNEHQFAPLANCDKLLQLDLYKPEVQELPERWLAACPVIEKLILKNAHLIHSFPQRLLEGASSLKRVVFSKVFRVQTLPAGFFEGTPNLVSFEMSYGKLKTLSSDVFRGPNLRSLVLSYNKLNMNEALKAISSMTTLTKLEVDHNHGVHDVCDKDGYSSLRNLVQLKELTLWQTGITRLCRDWRENLVNLQSTDLRATEITVLTYDDFQYKRNITDNCEVLINEQDISIRFTEDDYKKVVAAPAIAHSVKVSWDYDELKCDCNLYWFRKALDVPTFANTFAVNDMQCDDQTSFMKKTPEQLCPGKA